MQKQKTSGLTALASAAASVPGLGIAQLGGGGLRRAWIDVADAGDLKMRVGIESGGVVHATLCPCRRREQYTCSWFHFKRGCLSHSLTLAMT